MLGEGLFRNCDVIDLSLWHPSGIFLGWISPEIMVSLRNESLDGVSSEIAKAEAILVSG